MKNKIYTQKEVWDKEWDDILKGVISENDRIKRIDNILKLLGKYWKKNTNQRLGQLITNLTGNVYYMTDEELEEILLICSKCGRKR